MGAVPISMSRYMIDQRRAAQKSGQARPDTATLRNQYRQTFGKPTGVGPTSPLSDGPNMPRPNMPMPTDTGMPKATPMGGSQTSNLAILNKLNPGFNTGALPPYVQGGATGGNTGAPATTTFQGGATGGGGVAMPGTGNMSTPALPPGATFKRGGKVKKMASGGMTSKSSTASRRGDGIAQRGKTKGRMV